MKSQDGSKNLVDRIESRTAKVCVLGLGYVGLPLLEQIHLSGFFVFGFDTDEMRVSGLAGGVCSRSILGPECVRKLFVEDKVRVTSNSQALCEADIFWICVPTPAWQNKPDLENLISAFESIGTFAKKNCLIVVSSTSYPGSCRGVGLNILKERGFLIGEDVWVVISPEREDPGNPVWDCRNIPRVFAGSDQTASRMGALFLGKIFEAVHEATSLEAAEASKLLENSFRAVNIAFANEWAEMARLLRLDVFELIRLASTKPFGFMPFYPGAGVGGHCIPVDPLYLLESVKALGGTSGLVELACTENMAGPVRFVKQLAGLLGEKGLMLAGTSILILGITYKKNVADTRHSPALEVFLILKRAGCKVVYFDPWVPCLPGMEIQSLVREDLTAFRFEVVLQMVDHDVFGSLDVGKIARLSLTYKDVLRGFGVD